MKKDKAKTPTHAFVGYDSDGAAIEMMVDDGDAEVGYVMAEILRSGGSVQWVTIEAARQVPLYERPAP